MRMTIAVFARRIGFKNARAYGFKKRLHALEKRKLVRVKQGGFVADSMHHPRIVEVADMEGVQRYLGLQPCAPPVKWRRSPRCHHKDFYVVTVLQDLEVNEKRIRKLLLKCGHCDFYLVSFEVDGMMKRSQVYSDLA